MSKSRDIADSAATINFIDTVTSNVQTQLGTKAPLASPTFTGTATATAFSGDGSALTGIDSLPSQTGNAGEFLTTDGTNASWTPLSTSPTLEATASGALANGSAVIINSDGTVSEVNGLDAATGNATVFKSGSVTKVRSAFDSANNKVICVYQDVADSYKGKVQVGTISGTTVTFGTAATFGTSSGVDSIDVAYDDNAERIVICYRDYGNSSANTSIIGSVSGTTVTLGSSVVVETNACQGNAVVYNPDTQKIIVIYIDSNNSNRILGKVGTVSGSTITFGSGYQIASSTHAAQENTLDATYTEGNRVLFVYSRVSDSYGRVMTVLQSGNTLSNGQLYSFNSAATYFMSCTYNTDQSVAVITYRNGSSGGKARACSISGTNLSFGSVVEFAASNTLSTAVKYDFLSNKATVVYTDNNDSQRPYKSELSCLGTTITASSPVQLTSTSFSSSNSLAFGNGYYVMVSKNSANGASYLLFVNDGATTLSEGNYIGISNAAYSDAATATIQIVGSIDDAQSGLTAGTKYYVQPTGSLSATASTPSVVAGTAVSATKLIVKG